jgi:hypothetical protein
MLEHIVFGGKNAYHIFPSAPRAIKGFEPMHVNHGCVSTCYMQEEHVRRWTRLAYEFGVEFDGEFGYKLPKTQKRSELTFRQKKVAGFIPSHRRSDLAKLRRAARRGKREVFVKPLPAERLFATRYRLSAKDRRIAWWSLEPGERVPFRDFQSSCERGICLSAKGCRSPVPGIVFKALKRLYEKPERFLPDQLWFSKPVSDLKYILEVPSIPVKRQESRVRLKAGSLIRTYRSDVDRPGIPSIYNSTIPRVSRYDPIFADEDWHPDPSLAGVFFARTRAIDLSSW